MRRGAWGETPAEVWAASDHGVITARALEGLGIRESTTYRRCHQGGPWQRIAPGTILLHNGTPTRRQKEIAALLHAGPDALLTGMSAGRLHGLRRGPDPDHVHVLIPHTRHVRSWGFIRVERTSRMPRPLLRDDLPVAPLVRAILDEARLLKDPVRISALLAEPVQRGLVHPWSLREELDAGCRRGSAPTRSVLRAIENGVRSAAEFEAREWWLAHPELPEARFNVRVLDDAGRLVGVVDVLVEKVGFVWEIDSVEEHFATPAQVEDTLRRRRGLRGVGLYVISGRPTQRRDDPHGTLRDILDGLEVAALLPEPQVIYVDDLPR